MKSKFANLGFKKIKKLQKDNKFELPITNVNKTEKRNLLIKKYRLEIVRYIMDNEVNKVLATLNKLILLNFDINQPDELGFTLLQRCCSRGNEHAVKMLLHNGANTDVTGSAHKNTPLHEAAWNGFSKCLNLLILAGAKVNASNKLGFTPLHLTAQNGHNQSTRILLLAGSYVKKVNNFGDTPLQTAARYGHAGVTKLLIMAKSDLNHKNYNGDCALDIVQSLGYRKMYQMMIKHGGHFTNFNPSKCIRPVSDEKKIENENQVINKHKLCKGGANRYKIENGDKSFRMYNKINDLYNDGLGSLSSLQSGNEHILLLKKFRNQNKPNSVLFDDDNFHNVSINRRKINPGGVNEKRTRWCSDETALTKKYSIHRTEQWVSERAERVNMRSRQFQKRDTFHSREQKNYSDLDSIKCNQSNTMMCTPKNRKSPKYNIEINIENKSQNDMCRNCTHSKTESSVKYENLDDKLIKKDMYDFVKKKIQYWNIDSESGRYSCSNPTSDYILSSDNANFPQNTSLGFYKDKINSKSNQSSKSIKSNTSSIISSYQSRLIDKMKLKSKYKYKNEIQESGFITYI
ncbi:hypothetical protein A3Q56_03304 [Intoshia linei]|uniref:Uncharacterized protein n=1 Tax=Intoshia linei TaxID=1819745 RepID=A0A177B5R5_9BILA|nr:hypothetical protein A3Q56_03304 [Intoshia linei]